MSFLPTTGILSYFNPMAYSKQVDTKESEDQPPAYTPLPSNPPQRPAYNPPINLRPVYYYQPPREQMTIAETADVVDDMLPEPVVVPVCVCHCTGGCGQACGNVALPIIKGLGACAGHAGPALGACCGGLVEGLLKGL